MMMLLEKKPPFPSHYLLVSFSRSSVYNPVLLLEKGNLNLVYSYSNSTVEYSIERSVRYKHTVRPVGLSVQYCSSGGLAL